MRRNLLCHIYPQAEGQQWRHTVAWLLSRWDAFSGKKIVAVAVDRCTDTVAEVIEAFGERATEIEFLEFVNEPVLREALTLAPMLERVRSRNPDEATFFCHAKGSTRSDDQAMSHPWRDLMFHVCLDDVRLAECALHSKPICGAFRLFGRDGIDWIFAGSFYWFRHDAVFARDWRSVPAIWTGVENWPCALFQREESQCLFLDNSQTPYDAPYWQAVILPSFRHWQANLRRLGLSMKDYSPPTWLETPPPPTPHPTGPAGSVMTPLAKKSWRPMPIFRRLAAGSWTK